MGIAMKKRYAILPAAAATAAVVLLGTVGSADAITKAQTISLVAKQQSFHFSDTPPLKKENAGDSFQLAEALTHNGAKAGLSTIDCVVVVNHKTDLCQGAWSLPNGQITVAGQVPDNTPAGKSFNVAVTGGTGHFQNSRGQLTVTPSNGPTSTEVFHLIP
jgi:hypothetical protein